MADQGNSGSSISYGTAGGDHLNGGAGNDQLFGLAGADKLNAGAGADTVDGGSGSDRVSGDAGDDVAVYTISENAGASDIYDGGSGVDVLRLVMTRAEWLSAAVQQDVAGYQAFIAAATNPNNGQASNAEYVFRAFGLNASKFERLEVIVDGVAIDPRDQAVQLGADVMLAGEESPSLALDVLLNDSVADLVKSLSFTQPEHGTATLVARTSGAGAGSETAKFVYTPSPSEWQHLAAGQTATDTFTYTVIDADGDQQTATVTVTITGANDAPTITAATTATGAVAERADGASDELTATLTASGAVAFADVDLTDTHTATVTPSGAGYIGALSLSAVDQSANSVAWSYAAADGALDFLAAGETRTQTYAVSVSDGQGGSASQTLTVVLTGTNDAPTIASTVATGAVVEDGVMTAAGSVDFADVDLVDTHSVSSVAQGSGYFGAFTAEMSNEAAGDGAGAVRWTFNVDPAAIQHLAKDQVLTQLYTVRVADSQGAAVQQVVAITITGVNDAPLAVADVAQTGENQSVAIDVLANDTDADAGSVFTLVSANAAKGAVSIVDGKVVFAPGTAFDHLAVGGSENVVVNYVMSDQFGATSASTVTVAVTGANDAPTLAIDTNSAVNAVAENSANGALVGVTAFATDAESSVSYRLVRTDGSVGQDDGRFAINGSTGVVSVFDGTKFDYEASQSHALTVRATDAAGASTDKAFTVGVTDVVETRFAPRVLFVDDDANTTTSSTWLSQLQQLGYNVTSEVIPVNGDPVSNLANFDVVIWSVGDRAYTNLTAENVSTLTSYLNAGGRVLYAGGHNMYDEPNAAGLAANYFGVNNYQYNMPSVEGQAHLHTSGPGGTALTLSDFSDNPGFTSHYSGDMMSSMNAFGTARVMLEISSGGAHAGHSGYASYNQTFNDIAVYNTNGAFRTVVWGFDLNQVDPAYRADFLDDTLQLLAGQNWNTVWGI